MVPYTRASLIRELNAYTTSFAEEQPFRDSFLTLLNHPDSFQRHHLPGHITASAWIINHERSAVLLTLHAKLGKWLQPGGHADGDEDVRFVATKELQEETGLESAVLLRDSFFDLDIHPIPARKETAEHLHYDIRFLFQASDSAPLKITDESHDLRWFPIREIGTITGANQSLTRMVFKTSNL